MADIIHEHHEDNSSSSFLAVLIIIIVVAIAGFLLWRYLPARDAGNNNTGGGTLNLNVSTPGNSNTGGTSY